MFCLKIATLVIQFKWFITKLTHFILFFVSFWITLQKTWYYQKKIVKGTRIKLWAHLSNKALIKLPSVLCYGIWNLFMLHFRFVCMDAQSVKLRSYQRLIKIKWYFQVWTERESKLRTLATLSWIKSRFLLS